MTRLEELPPMSIGGTLRKINIGDEHGWVERYKILILTSPLWLAVLLIGAESFSSDFRHVLQFIGWSPLR
jgi:hypothetical protein